jgi:hypothetical protein
MSPWHKVLSMKSFSFINEEAQEFFLDFGWVLTDGLDIEQTRLLQQWVQEVDNWEVDGTFLRHEEMTSEGPKVARIEYFTHIHQGLGEFLAGGQMLKDASALLGEQVVLYKEKINFKLSGGAGWSPHQDAPAYPFIRTHISCMVAVDDATIENGCLEVVSHAHEELLPQDEKGCIRADIVDTMTWEPVELRAGQTLWFHSRTPHQSGDNLSQRNRRALYPTYNALSEGDLRQEYYEEKMKAFMEMKEGGETVRVSLVDDFRGIPVR